MGSLKEFLEKQNVQENSERCSVYAVYEITKLEAFLYLREEKKTPGQLEKGGLGLFVKALRAFHSASCGAKSSHV